MAQPFDICIRGSGIVGRSLALMLARERLRVALVESPLPAGEDVRAYALNAASRGLLESVRAWPDAADATPVLAMEVAGDDGGHVHFSAAQQGAPALAWIVDVPALEDLLAQAVRYQPLVETVATPVPAALTVVCEGRHSRTRTEFGVAFDVTPYGQHGLATRAQCEKPHEQIARQWFAEGGVLAFLPLNGPGGNSVAVVWSVQESKADALMALTPEAFASQLTQASHGALGALTLQSARAAWPLQLAQAQRWSGPGWALAGDAAHTLHPLAGQGLNVGLQDVAELAKVLRERAYWRSLGDARVLRQYERARKADLLWMRAATDGLQQLFAQTGAAPQRLRNWGMNGFERSGVLKHWVARQAMGQS